MQFTTASLASLAAALAFVLAPLPAHAGISAFSTFTCGGSIGPDVPCDGSCHSFSGRHSFVVDSGSGPHCVTAFVDADCPEGGDGFTFSNQEGSCQTVQTGTPIQSFICSPNNVCRV